MKKLILSIVFVFTTITIVSGKSNMERLNILNQYSLKTEKTIMPNMVGLSFEKYSILEYTELCATIAFKAANLVESLSGSEFTYDDWAFVFNAVNTNCVISRMRAEL